MDCTLARDLDPLDLEVLERALESTTDAIKSSSDVAELESDEELELELRRELAEMACADGVSDPNALLDILIEGMGKKVREA
ncbi:MAG: hypothetical protein ACTSRM_02010 [Alphaproteobacteria bacterium]